MYLNRGVSLPWRESLMEYEIARRTPRYSFVVDVEVADLQSEIQIRERTTTLSLFGCGINTSKGFPPGTRVRIKLSHRGAEMSALGRVAYARPGVGMGVVFTTVEPEEGRVLEQWIAELASLSLA